MGIFIHCHTLAFFLPKFENALNYRVHWISIDLEIRITKRGKVLAGWVVMRADSELLGEEVLLVQVWGAKPWLEEATALWWGCERGHLGSHHGRMPTTPQGPPESQHGEVAANSKRAVHRPFLDKIMVVCDFQVSSAFLHNFLFCSNKLFANIKNLICYDIDGHHWFELF